MIKNELLRSSGNLFLPHCHIPGHDNFNFYLLQNSPEELEVGKKKCTRNKEQEFHTYI